MITLDSATNEQLLLELINRFGIESCPSHTSWPGDYRRVTVECEESEAVIIIDADDYLLLLDSEL